MTPSTPTLQPSLPSHTGQGRARLTARNVVEPLIVVFMPTFPPGRQRAGGTPSAAPRRPPPAGGARSAAPGRRSARPPLGRVAAGERMVPPAGVVLLDHVASPRPQSKDVTIVSVKLIRPAERELISTFRQAQ